jgi:hypothetical protein
MSIPVLYCLASQTIPPRQLLRVEVNVIVTAYLRTPYRAYLRELAKLPVDAPLMLEHLKTLEEYEEGREYIRKVGKSISVAFT